LGKAWEDLQKHDNSFYYYAEGNRIARDTIDFEIADVQRKLEITKQLFSARFFSTQRVNRSGSEELIFIVGLPRCGSTLVSSILAAHPQAINTGETDLLYHIVGALSDGNKGHIDPQKFSQISHEQIETAAKEYLNTTLATFGESEKYIDKALLNFWLCGFIHLLFPNAKILHSYRNPLDNCFSIFANALECSDFTFAYHL